MNYINTTTHTSASRYQIRQDNPNVSLPADPSALQLALLGYAIIEPVEPPEGDVVGPGEPEHYATETETHTYEVEVERDVEVENEEGETVLETETVIEERTDEVEIQRWRQTWTSRGFTPEELEDQRQASIPPSVTPRQARLALLQAGLLDQVAGALDSLPSPDREAAQIEWEYATAIERGSAWIGQLGSALGLSEDQIDDLFIAAAGV